MAAGTYRENIAVAPRATITIEGEGPDRPCLLARDPNVPVVQVLPEGSLALKGLSLHGTRANLVLGASGTNKAARSVTVVDTAIVGAEYGIYGNACRFHLERSSVAGNVYGLVLGGSATVVNAYIANTVVNLVFTGANARTACNETALYKTTNNVLLQNVTICGGQRGGLAVCNMASAIMKCVCIVNSSLVGIRLRLVKDFQLIGSLVFATRALNGDFGDGLEVFKSDGLVQYSSFLLSERANIIYWASFGTIENNLSTGAVFALHLETGSDPIIANNLMVANTENEVTYGQSLTPTPSPPIPEV